MDKFADRLKALRKSKGFTQEELGEKMGTSRVAYSKYERGVMSPTLNALSKLAEALGVHPVDFFQNETDKTQSAEKLTSNSRGNIIYLPVELNAGFTEMYDSQGVRQEQLEEFERYSLPGYERGLYFLMHVRNDSMNNTFKSGDKVLVKAQPEDKGNIRGGEVYALYMKDGDMREIKRVFKLKNPKYVMLRPDNRLYQSRVVEIDSITQMHLVVEKATTDIGFTGSVDELKTEMDECNRLAARMETRS